MPRVVHFEFNADDPERAVRFYSEVFGWDIQKWGGPAAYWLVSTGEGVGIDGAVQRAPEFVAGQRTVVTMDVDSVDDTVAKVEAAGGSVVLPKMAIPNVGWLVYFRDTEGMLFGAMQSDESATGESAAPASEEAAAPAREQAAAPAAEGAAATAGGEGAAPAAEGAPAPAGDEVAAPAAEGAAAPASEEAAASADGAAAANESAAPAQDESAAPAAAPADNESAAPPPESRPPV